MKTETLIHIFFAETNLSRYDNQYQAVTQEVLENIGFFKNIEYIKVIGCIQFSCNIQRYIKFLESLTSLSRIPKADTLQKPTKI